MSSANPPGPERWTFGRPPENPPFPTPVTTPPPRRRFRVHPTTILIISSVLLMVVSFAVIPFVSPVIDRWMQSQQPPQRPMPSAPVTPPDPGSNDRGGAGVGDPYYPDYGSSGYNALKYTIDVNWAASIHRLSGTTTIRARSDHLLRSFYVDLVLPVSQVTVNGQPATFSREGIYDVRIVPRRPVAADAIFRVTVYYGGNPADYTIGNTRPWWVTGNEVTAAGEPEGSAWWYPANDHPSDPATFDVTVTVPSGMEAISNGRLVQHATNTSTSTDSWHWATNQTMDTYQSLLSIGQYAIKQGTADGRPYLYAVSMQLPKAERDKAFKSLEQTPKIIADEETIYGPYPYGQIGGLVPSHKLWFAGLESATRPVYAANAITDGHAAGLMTHELAHSWFGDHVTLKQWDDIFISEAYASFTEWWRAEKTGGTKANDQLQKTYDEYEDQAGFWRISMIDPGPDHLFDVVYFRGPMTLQALRNVIGDAAFFKLSRQWAQRGGVHSLEDWMAMAKRVSGVNLDGFFQAWIYGPTPPARTAANGLG
jgi:aminopeptidase N